ncbi:MAG: protease complex subunit PrcB family protein [Elusimicrobia bacterium]|nr:protease complex subunit PrcB family protein [Elusimicrobiota bacterium]
MSDITKEQLSAYLDNALSAEERALVDRALASSPDLQKELAQMKRLGDLLRAEPVPEPVESFYDRVMEKTKHRSRPWIQWTVPLLGAAAAAMVMVLVLHDRPEKGLPVQMMARLADPGQPSWKQEFDSGASARNGRSREGLSRRGIEPGVSAFPGGPLDRQTVQLQGRVNVPSKPHSYANETARGRGEVEGIAGLGAGEDRKAFDPSEVDIKNISAGQKHMDRLQTGPGMTLGGSVDKPAMILSPGAPRIEGLSTATKPADPALNHPGAVVLGPGTSVTESAGFPFSLKKDLAGKELAAVPAAVPSVDASFPARTQEVQRSQGKKQVETPATTAKTKDSGLVEKRAMGYPEKLEYKSLAISEERAKGLAGGGSLAPPTRSDEKVVALPDEIAPEEIERKGKTAPKAVSKNALPPSAMEEPPAAKWQGDSSGIEDERQVVIRDAATWAKFWAEHQSHMGIPAPTPAVDFKTRMVVGIFVGSRGSSGYTVQITGVSENSKEMTLSYKETTPNPDMAFLTVMTQPYHLKTVPRSNLPVRFIKK